VQKDKHAIQTALAKRLPVLPTGIPTDIYPSVFHGELQKNYDLLPQLPTGIPTDIYPSVFHKELHKNYGILPQLPTGIPADI
jgi:hypothetical protein